MRRSLLLLLGAVACGGGATAPNNLLNYQQGCASDTDCPGGQICDTQVTQECQTPCIAQSTDAAGNPISTAQDSLCPSGQVCNPYNGYCRLVSGTCNMVSGDTDCQNMQGMVCSLDASGDSVCMQGCDGVVACPGAYTCAADLELCSTAGQAPPLGPDPAAHPQTPTKYPIVLVHGFDSTSWISFSDIIVGSLENDGHTVYFTDASPVTDVATRSTEVLSQIRSFLQQNGASKVNLICHSMGGLDCRYIASPGGLGQDSIVASITTLGTPHQGSPFADTMVSLIQSSALTDIILTTYAQQEAISLMDSAGVTNLLGALTDISVGNAPMFNAHTPDSPNVYYQSWAGIATYRGGVDGTIGSTCRNDLLNPNHSAHVESYYYIYEPIVGGLTDSVPNDGLVPVSSAIYGNFQGCVPADHAGLTGASHMGSGFLLQPDPVTGWEPVRFFRNLAYQLADQGL